MPLRNARPLTFRPTTVCDCTDGTNGPPGAMLALTNLIPNPFTDKTWVPRPAAVGITAFPGFTLPGFISGRLIVGDIEYGMIATSLFPGNDQPYAFNLATRTFLTVSGITAANTPASPPTSGPWTPPILAQVGTRIIVTHPGFPGGSGPYFGWFDLSGFSETTTGDTNSSTLITGAPSIVGVQPGLSISGTGIPLDTVIESAAEYVNDTTASLNAVALQITSVASLTGVLVGQNVQPALPYAGIPLNTSIVAISGSTVTMSRAATVGGVGVGVYFRAVTTGSTTNGSDLLTSVADTSLIGVGQMITGLGIPAGTTVLSVGPGVVQMSANATADTSGEFIESYTLTTGDVVVAPTTLTNVANTAGVAVGQNVAGEGIPTATTVASVSGSTVTVSNPVTAAGDNIAVTFSGATITLSQAATATANGVALTIGGGSPTSPLWGAGNTNINPLTAVPVSVAQMAGSAFYAVGSAVVISDPLLPVQVTNANQALTFSNGLAVTALGPLPLNSLLGGIVQSIIAFQGVSAMQQITGSPALNNLAVNQLPVPTGTLAPLSVTPTTQGLVFVSPDGLRIINFACQVGDPIGDHGQGVAAPFIFSTVPSRMCAAANADTLRISVVNSLIYQSPTQEFWWDFSRRIWTGAHTFGSSLIQPWRDTFVSSLTGVPATLWQSDAIPNTSNDFTENGLQLGFFYATSLLPDNGAMAENAIVETTVMMALPSASQVSVGFNSDEGNIIDSQILFGIQKGASIYNQTIWGQGYWGSAGAPVLVQRQIPWAKPMVFKQGALTIAGASAPGIVLGNAFLRYQVLGYLLERAS